MDYTIFIPVLISFALSVVMGPVIIPILRRLKMGQTEREEGVKSHLKKAGTPTMGGVIILIAVVVTSVFYIGDYPNIIPILFVTLGFGLIGFLDDYLKVVLKRSDGLFPKQKNGSSDPCDGSICLLYGEIYRCFSRHVNPLFRRKISGYRMACDPAPFCGGDRNSKRSQFY